MPKTTKKNVKVRDLKPSKDAKGGGPGVQGTGPSTQGGPGVSHRGHHHSIQHGHHHSQQ